MREIDDEIGRLAWTMHLNNGHPEGYNGPCWGPTLEERTLAREQISARSEAAKPLNAGQPPGRDENGSHS